MPSLGVETLAGLRARSCIIDDEAVACDHSGVASFELVRHQRARRERSRDIPHRPMCYIMQHRHPPIAVVSGAILWATAEVKLVGCRPFMRR